MRPMARVRFQQVQYKNTLPRRWYASTDLLKELSVVSGDKINIAFGSYAIKVQLLADDEYRGLCLGVPSAVKPYLPFSLNTEYYCSWNVNEQVLRLGPLMAILVADNKQYQATKEGKPFHGRLHFFEEIVTYARKLGAYAFCITPSGLKVSKGRVNGYTFEDGQWKSVVLPLPDVVYNRVSSRKLEERNSIGTAKNAFDESSIPLFNRDFLNKWHLHQILEQKQATATLLPKTEAYHSPKQIVKFLKHFNTVYCKPLHSFAGHGIMRIDKTAQGYIVKHRDSEGNVGRTYSSIDSAIWLLHRNMAQKQYVLQQGVDLAKYNGRSFDVRLLLQRDRGGQWRLTGMGSRVAGKGRITTHVPNGGSIAAIKEVLQRSFGTRWLEIYNSIKETALLIAPIIEEHYNYQFGIMSMDIGVDAMGKLWLFEANSKPMEFDERFTQRRSLIRLVHYCRYLAGMGGELSSD